MQIPSLASGEEGDQSTYTGVGCIFIKGEIFSYYSRYAYRVYSSLSKIGNARLIPRFDKIKP